MQQKRLLRMPRLRTKTLLIKILLNQIIWTICFTVGKLVKKSLNKAFVRTRKLQLWDPTLRLNIGTQP
jgi:hypothetical protein